MALKALKAAHLKQVGAYRGEPYLELAWVRSGRDSDLSARRFGACAGGRGDNMMAGIYSELRGFVLAHRGCAGPRHADVDPLTPDGYRLLAKCGCGVEFKRWVAPEDADEDLLRSALLAFEN